MAAAKGGLFPTFRKAVSKKEGPGIIGRTAGADVTPTLKKAGGWFAGLGQGRIVPDWMKKLFRSIIGLTLSLAVLILLVVGGYVGYVWFTSGAVGTVADHAQVAGKEKALPFLERVGLDKIFDPTKAVESSSFSSQVESNAYNEDLGLRISNLEPFGRVFSGEPIELIGTIEIESFPEEMQVEVNCELEDYPGVIPAELLTPTATLNTATIYKGQREVIQATCFFEDGIKVEDPNEVFESKIAKMSVSYDFETKATHKLYTLSREARQRFMKRGVDSTGIFDESGIIEPLLGYDGRMRTIYSSGPMALGITTEQSQPFSEGTPYILKVGLTSNLDWLGELEDLNALELQLPYYVSLEGDSEFGTSSLTSQCAFENTGEIITDVNSQGEEYNYKIYRLKDVALENINTECSREALLGTQITIEQCRNIFKDRPFRCKFKVGEGHASPVMQWDEIRAVARYNFKTEKNSVVSIVNMYGEVPEQGFANS